MLTINYKFVKTKPGDTVLDLGCGEGRHAIGALFHAPNIYVVAIDLSLSDLKVAKLRHREFDHQASQRCLYARANGYILPFSDQTFDHIVCSEVLEHVEDYSSMLEEIKRILKPGGTLNISVPRFWPEKICWALSKEYHQVEGGHIRIFKSRELRKNIQNYSFRFIKRHWAHSLHVPYWWLRCAFWIKGENFFLTRWYHKLLVWDLLKRPRITQALERLLNPVLGKSVVMYFEKQ